MKKLYTSFLISSLFTLNVNAQSTQLIVRGFSEGFYRSSTGKMNAVLDPVNQPLVCDSATIELIDVISNQTVLCSNSLINTDGYGEVYVPSAMSGMDYFVSIKFKNTFHLLSATPIQMNGQPVTVDLTVPQNTCCNYDTTHGVAKAYSGDVNYDGSIDVLDLTLWENDYHGNPNGYHLTDVNGDHVVDTADLAIMENHSNMGAADDYFSNCSPTIFSGVSELDNQSFNVYPNPASTEINLVCDGRNGQEMQVTFFDVTGREVKKLVWEQEVKKNIDVSNLSPGLYLINLLSSGGTSFVRELVIK